MEEQTAEDFRASANQKRKNAPKVFRRSNKINIISHSRYIEKPRTSTGEVT